MNFVQYKTTGGDSMFLKWSDSSTEKPFRFKISGEPEKEMFRGKTKYKLPVTLPGGVKKMIDISQRALNQLIEAAQSYGVLESIGKVVWVAWVEGESYETSYHWVVEGGTRSAPTAEPARHLQAVPEPADEFSSVDEDDIPF